MPKLEFAPGVVKVDAPHSVIGRYIDCDKVRFVKGKPEKWRGWESFSTEVLGIIRSLLSWDDNNDSRWLAAGSHLGLYVVNVSGSATKITPFVSTGTLGSNPISTTDTSAIVTIADTAHGLTVGAYVTLSGATAVGGITINGEYAVNSVIDVDSYTIIHSSAASATATGGGAGVTYSYEINPGYANVVQGLGWGTGTWGTGTWGTPRTTSNFTVYARMWSLDNYGENLLALVNGGRLYQWDPDAPTDRAAVVANSPTGNFMFVTNERYPVILGADSDNMALAWPDQNDITNWTPGSTSTAASRRLQKGSRLVAGANLVHTANILWTDSAAYTMTYTGSRTAVYSTIIAGERCGLIGPQAFFVMGGRAFWMSSFDFFMYGGTVRRIPNSEDIRDWVFDQLDGRQNWKVAAHYASQHNEGRWHFIPEGEFEPTIYVAVSLDDFSWTHGTLERTAWVEKSGVNPTTFGADHDGVIYKHEVGLDADGAALSWHLESAPIDFADGGIFDIHGYVPNFKRQTGDIELTLTFYDLPQKTTALETFTETIIEGQGIVDVHAAGRQVSVRLDGFQVGGDFRLGIGEIEIIEGGNRRGEA